MEDQYDRDAIALLVARVKPILAGAGPCNQGGAMGEIVAMWLAGHPAHQREQLLKLWLELVIDLAREYSKAHRGTPGPELDADALLADTKTFH